MVRQRHSLPSSCPAETGWSVRHTDATCSVRCSGHRCAQSCSIPLYRAATAFAPTRAAGAVPLAVVAVRVVPAVLVGPLPLPPFKGALPAFAAGPGLPGFPVRGAKTGTASSWRALLAGVHEGWRKEAPVHSESEGTPPLQGTSLA